MIITVIVIIKMEVSITNASIDLPERRRRLGLISVLLGQFMLVIDATIVNVALPVIQADLHLSGPRLTWVRART